MQFGFHWRFPLRFPTTGTTCLAGILLVVWVGWAKGAVVEDPLAIPNEGTAEVKTADASPVVATAASAVPVGVARLELQGSLPEGVESPGLLGTLQPNLRNFLRRLEDATRDDRVQAVWLQPRQAMLGRGQIHELQQAIHAVRKAGKRVYADLQIATPSDYLIAMACDEIWMPESAFLLLPGIRAELMYYRSLLDKLHIEPDMLQIGDYKGASEPIMRTEMSPAFRGQFHHVIDDLFSQMVEEIARERQMPMAAVRSAVDQGMLTATDAHRRGLIDRVAYASGAEMQLQRDLGANAIRFLPQYGKPDLDTDFSGMAGFFKMMDLMTGATRHSANASSGKVAVVYASGPIMPGKSSTGLAGQATVGGDSIVDALRKAELDKSVAAIVLRVDSPGGSALASDLIWKQIRACEKPVVASMGNMAASGGYYIAMGCDRVVAEPGTITGSIGVVGGKMALRGLWNLLGISTEVIARGQNAGILSSQERFTDSERAAMRNMMEDVYQQFLNKAAQARGKSVEEMRPLAEGRLWTGRQAAANGLVDAVGTLHDAIREARRLAGVLTDQPAEIMALPEPKGILEQMLEGPQAQVSPVTFLREWQILQEWQWFQPMLREPVLLWLPYQVQIQ